MTTSGTIQRYYLGLVVVFVFVLIALGYTVSQAGNEKIDRQTDTAVQNIADKLDSYTLNRGVPDSLSQAGISNVPSTITYSTGNNHANYKICINYKSASSGFDASWFSLVSGAATAASSGSSTIYPTTDHSYFDSSVIYNHKKGQNCQTVTPYSTSPYPIYNLQNSTNKTPSIGT